MGLALRCARECNIRISYFGQVLQIFSIPSVFFCFTFFDSYFVPTLAMAFLSWIPLVSFATLSNVLHALGWGMPVFPL